jgi:hypothetical protein
MKDKRNTIADSTPKTSIASEKESSIAATVMQLFLLLGNFNAFVDCAQMITTVGAATIIAQDQPCPN